MFPVTIFYDIPGVKEVVKTAIRLNGNIVGGFWARLDSSRDPFGGDVDIYLGLDDYSKALKTLRGEKDFSFLMLSENYPEEVTGRAEFTMKLSTGRSITVQLLGTSMTPKEIINHVDFTVCQYVQIDHFVIHGETSREDNETRTLRYHENYKGGPREDMRERIKKYTNHGYKLDKPRRWWRNLQLAKVFARIGKLEGWLSGLKQRS